MAGAEKTDLIGKLVGRYRIEKRLGSGGMGDVYLGRQVEIGSRVAIKVMARGKTDSEGAKRMFAEARAVNLVQHDRIVNVLDMTRIDGRPALIMEYLRGVSLDRLIGGGPVPPICIAEIAIDILDALSAVHAQEIYHRDLKPGNVYVSPEGRATLLDFGLAKMADDLLGTVIQTQVGIVMGTVPYMAPEQARGEPFIPASDLFAVGVILYEGATAHRPYRGANIPELLKEHKQGAKKPGLIVPTMPPNLEAVIMKALEVDLEARYKTAGEMRMALIEVARTLEPASLRSRVERFREKSQVFVGVSPAFSNAPTVRERSPGPSDAPPALAGRGRGADARGRQPAVSSSPPPAPTRASRSYKLLIAATAVATIAAIVSTVFALSMRSELTRVKSEAAESKTKATPATSVNSTKVKPDRDRDNDTDDVPSLADWDVDPADKKIDAGVRRTLQAVPVKPRDDKPKDKPNNNIEDPFKDSDLINPFGSRANEPTSREDLRAAKRVLASDPKKAETLITRAIRNGGRTSEYYMVKAEAHCRRRNLTELNATLTRLTPRKRKRVEDKCKTLWPAYSADPRFLLE